MTAPWTFAVDAFVTLQWVADEPRHQPFNPLRLAMRLTNAHANRVARDGSCGVPDVLCCIGRVFRCAGQCLARSSLREPAQLSHLATAP